MNPIGATRRIEEGNEYNPSRRKHKTIRPITHEEAIRRAKREADAYFMLKPDSNTEATVAEQDKHKLPPINWKVSRWRKDKRTGALRRVRPSFYVRELMRAEEARHVD